MWNKCTREKVTLVFYSGKNKLQLQAQENFNGKSPPYQTYKPTVVLKKFPKNVQNCARATKVRLLCHFIWNEGPQYQVECNGFGLNGQNTISTLLLHQFNVTALDTMFSDVITPVFLTTTWHDNNVIITSKRRCGVLLTLWWLYYYVMYMLRRNRPCLNEIDVHWTLGQSSVIPPWASQLWCGLANPEGASE